jgi:glutaredoxin
MPAYEADLAKFGALDAQVLGISIDHTHCLKAWAESLGGIDYPLLSDFWPHGAIAQQYGVFRPDGRSERAIFIVDKEGVIRYVDVHDIDEQPSNEVLFDELRRIDPRAAKAASTAPQPAGQTVALPKGGVVLYCTSWCPDCRRARAWLKEREISFTEVDVNAVPEGAKQVRRWASGNLITPTFDINGTIVVDFNREKLAELLG